MVATRHSLSGRSGTPESADDPKVQAVLRKLRIDGTDALKGDRVNSFVDRPSNKIYRSKGANYLEVGNEPQEWLAHHGRRRRGRSSRGISDDHGDDEGNEELEHATEHEVAHSSRRKRRNNGNSDARYALSTRTDVPPRVEPRHSSHSNAECSHARVIHEANEANRLRDLHDNRRVAASKGFKQFPLSEKTLADHLDRTIATKLIKVARLNSQIAKKTRSLIERDFHPRTLKAAIEKQKLEVVRAVGLSQDCGSTKEHDSNVTEEGLTVNKEKETTETCEEAASLKQTIAISSRQSPDVNDRMTPPSDEVLASCETSFVTANQSPKDHVKHYHDLDDFPKVKESKPLCILLTDDDRDNRSDSASTVADQDITERVIPLPSRISTADKFAWTLDLAKLEQSGRAEEAIHRNRVDSEGKAARVRRMRHELTVLRNWPNFVGSYEIKVSSSS